MRAAVVICLLLLLTAPSVSAQATLQGAQCVVSRDEVIDSDLIVLCGSLRLEGMVRGDLIGTATNAMISGTVEGSIYLLAGRLDLRGQVGRDLHFAGSALHMYASALFSDERASVYSLSLSTTLEDAALPGSLLSLGYQLIAAGDIGGDIRFAGSALALRASVAGDVDAVVGSETDTLGGFDGRFLLPLVISSDVIEPGLRVERDAQVGGVLRYAAASEGAIDAALTNAPVFTRIAPQPEIVVVDEEEPSAPLLTFVSQVVREWAMLLAVGALLLLLLPRLTAALTDSWRARPLYNIGVGALGVFAAVPSGVIVAVIGVTAGMLLATMGLLALGAGVAGLALTLALGGAVVVYFIAGFIARALVCIGVGALLLRVVPGRASGRSVWLSLALGSLAAALLMSLPLVGWLINVLAALAGLGALIGLWVNQLRPTNVPRPAVIYYPPARQSAGNYPPPPMDDEPPALAPGMDNLPEGFNWWK
jgi:hypothetical protein